MHSFTSTARRAPPRAAGSPGRQASSGRRAATQAGLRRSCRCAGGEAGGGGRDRRTRGAPVTQLLEIACTRCFYEIIRAGRECKAYFDLEADPGVWGAEQGLTMCRAVIREWERRVLGKWPEARQECPCCLAYMILDGSRMTDEGWKVSYHVVYPWLVFPCNTTML